MLSYGFDNAKSSLQSGQEEDAAADGAVLQIEGFSTGLLQSSKSSSRTDNAAFNDGVVQAVRQLIRLS